MASIEAGFGSAPRHPCRRARWHLRHFVPPTRPVILSPQETVSFFDEDDEPRTPGAAATPRAPSGDVAADTQTIRVRQAVAAIGLIVRAAAARLRGQGLPRLAPRRTRSRTTTARSPRSPPSPSKQVGAAVLRAARRGRQRVAAGPADRDLELPRPGRAAARAGRGPRRPGRDARRAAVAADRAGVAPRRARLHRAADPHALGDDGRRRRRGDRGRSPARCRCSSPPTSIYADARRARRSSPRSTTTRSAARTSRQSRVPALDRLAAARRGRPAARPAALRGRRPRQGRADRAGPARHGIDSVVARRHDAAARRAQPARPTRRTPPSPSKFTNHGENDEFDVKVTVRIQGSGKPDHAHRHDRPDRPEGQRDRQPRPREAAAARRRGHDPGARRAVPGEEKTDNNQAEYQGLFAEG